MRDTVRDWLRDLAEQGYSPRTLDLYGQYVGEFAEAVPKAPALVMKADCTGFLEALRGRGLSGTSRVVVHAALSAFFRWCHEEGRVMVYRHNGLTLRHPMEAVKRPRKDTGPQLVARPEDIVRLMGAAASNYDTALAYRNTALVAVLVSTGIRRAECVSLGMEDVDLETGRVVIRRGKGGKQRVVFLDSLGLAFVARWLGVRSNATAALWTTRHGAAFQVESLSKLMASLSRTGGVSRRITAHQLRRYWAGIVSKAAREEGSGILPQDILQAGGWTQDIMRAKYAAWSDFEFAGQGLARYSPLTVVMGQESPLLAGEGQRSEGLSSPAKAVA